MKRSRRKKRKRNRRGVRARRRLRRRWPDEIRLSDYSEAGDHGKRSWDQRDPEHAGISGGTEGDEDRNQGSGAGDLQSKSRFGAYRELSGKRTAAGQVYRLPSGLEEGIRALEEWREDAGVRAESVIQSLVASREA